MIERDREISVKRRRELLDLSRSSVIYITRGLPERDLRLMRLLDELHLKWPFYGARSALGLSDEDLEKPKIAIVNSSSQLASCFSHLDEIVAPLKKAMEDAGGVAFEVRAAAPSDAITSAGAAGQYILPSRDLIASDIEVAVEGALLDGMVCLASCDKTSTSMVAAGLRIVVPGEQPLLVPIPSSNDV